MIVKTNYVDWNGTEHEDLILTKSDSGRKIRQVETGRVFDEAVDPKYNKKEYIEIEDE